MSSSIWIPLAEYSSRYRVSVSTLRRRIKSGEAEHQFIEGKYLLKNTPLDEHQKSTLAETKDLPAMAPPQESGPQETLHLETETKAELEAADFVRAAQELVAELKTAYAVILQEKEEQILDLREEVADLKTLVKALEDANNRLRENLRQSQSIDEWLGPDLGC